MKTESMHSIPWDRLVHFYGRATDIPELIGKLQGEQHAAVAEKLAYVLEHQDGVSQATPFAVAKIIEIYPSLSFEQKSSINRLLTTIKKAAEFTVSSPAAPKDLFSISQLLQPRFLWPPYESEDADEELWEELDLGQKEYYSYAHATLQFLNNFVP